MTVTIYATDVEGGGEVEVSLARNYVLAHAPQSDTTWWTDDPGTSVVFGDYSCVTTSCRTK